MAVMIPEIPAPIQMIRSGLMVSTERSSMAAFGAPDDIYFVLAMMSAQDGRLTDNKTKGAAGVRWAMVI